MFIITKISEFSKIVDLGESLAKRDEPGIVNDALKMFSDNFFIVGNWFGIVKTIRLEVKR